MSFSAMLTLEPGCSPWWLRPAVATLRLGVTEGGGGTDMERDIGSVREQYLRSGQFEARRMASFVALACLLANAANSAVRKYDAWSREV
jgi:hypothetical protein